MELPKLAYLPFVATVALVVFQKVALAEPFDYKNLSKSDIKAIQNIVTQYSAECSEFHGNLEDKHVELRDDQIIRHRLLQDQSTLLVLEASFQCEGFGHPWSGSAGSPTYLIIKGRAFEIVSGGVSTFHINESATVINVWHHASNCKSIESDDIDGAKPCFSAIYWDGVSETFSWFAGRNPIKQVN